MKPACAIVLLAQPAYLGRVLAAVARQFSGRKHAFHWPCPLRRVRHDLNRVRGGGFCFWRDHLIRVHGYEETANGWGREDSELALRLMNSGVRRLEVRGWALCYHLWHPPARRGSLSANDQLLEETQREEATRCERGLNQHLLIKTA